MRIHTFLTSASIATAALLVGCNGDTDGGKASGSGFRDDVFVSDETTTGSITLQVVEPEIQIGETSGFFVFVKNADGQPVRATNVVCDSEEGVAIIEPTQGNEITNDQGEISGRIGCERPGSFQLACRLSTGANKRDLVDIKCRGEVPADFQGFPGAAGGGLGGGVAVTNDGQVRITSISVQEEELSSDTRFDASVDVVQQTCEDGETTEPEPFFDTYVAIRIENNLREKVRLSYVEYSVPNANRRGATFNSQRLGVTSFASSTLDANGDVQTLVLPVFKAFGGGKYFGNAPGSGETGLEIASNLGLKTITFTVVGQTSSGKSVSISGDVTVSFSNFNNCE
jgi:hypothetical protein